MIVSNPAESLAPNPQRFSGNSDEEMPLFQPSPLPKPFRVLVVEDNEHDRIAFARALNRSEVEFSIESHERGEAAAERILNDASDIHLVVIDYNLPGMNGLQVFNHLRREAGETVLPPFLMLTGAGNEDLAVRAIKAGFYDYLVKDPDDRYFTLLPTLMAAVFTRHENAKAFRLAQQQLAHSHKILEETVAERTRELKRTVEVMQGEVAERRQAEKALWASRQRLRQMAARAMEAQENERKAIAQELHDGVAASLTGIKMSLEIRIHQMGDPPLKKGMTLEDVVDRLKSIISEVSHISARLRPESLDGVGLLGLMRNTLQALENQYDGVRVSFSPEVEEEAVPEPLKVVFYRIAQEAANNALRHGNPSRVDVTLARENPELVLTVADNGDGFDVKEVVYSPGPGGYGLKSMRDRAEINRGTLEISSTPGAGTRVRAAFDLRDFAPADS